MLYLNNDKAKQNHIIVCCVIYFHFRSFVLFSFFKNTIPTTKDNQTSNQKIDLSNQKINLSYVLDKEKITLGKTIKTPIGEYRINKITSIGLEADRPEIFSLKDLSIMNSINKQIEDVTQPIYKPKKDFGRKKIDEMILYGLLFRDPNLTKARLDKMSLFEIQEILNWSRSFSLTSDIFLDKDLYTFQVYAGEDSWGAHPSHSSLDYTFDLKTGKRLGLG